MLVGPLLVTSGDLTQVQEVQVGAVNSGNQVGEAEVEGRSEVVRTLVIRLTVWVVMGFKYYHYRCYNA